MRWDKRREGRAQHKRPGATAKRERQERALDRLEAIVLTEDSAIYKIGRVQDEISILRGKTGRA